MRPAVIAYFSFGRSEKGDPRGLHFGARRIDVVHAEAHHRTGGEVPVLLVVRAEHLDMRAVWQAEDREAGFLELQRKAKCSAVKLRQLVVMLRSGAQPT